MTIYATTLCGKVLVAPLMSNSEWTDVRKYKTPLTIMSSKLPGHSVEKHGIRFFRHNPGAAPEAAVRESFEDLRVLSEIVLAADDLGWTVRSGNELPGVQVDVLCQAPSGGHRVAFTSAMKTKSIGETILADAARITDAVPVWFVSDRSELPKALHPFAVHGVTEAEGDLFVKGTPLREFVQEILVDALVGASSTNGHEAEEEDGVADRVRTLNYFGAVEALAPMRIGKPAGPEMRAFGVRVGEPVDWSPSAKTARDTRMETLSLVNVGLYTSKAAIEAVESLLGAAPAEDMDDDATAVDDAADTRKNSRAGDCALASFVVNGSGSVEPGSFRLTTFAASIGAMSKGGMTPNAETLESICSRAEDEFADRFTGKQVDVDALGHILGMIKRMLGRTPELSEVVGRVVQFQIRRKTEDAEERRARIDEAVPRFGSFFLRDIQHAAELVGDGKLPNSPLYSYLAPCVPSGERTDAGSAGVIASAARVPVLGKWGSGASDGGAVMSWRQRVVASEVSAMSDELISVCGPPGTGKSFIIKELVGFTVVRRAMAMTEFDDPLDAFEQIGTAKMSSGRHAGKSFPVWSVGNGVGAGIGIFSSNNAAVEHVVREMGCLSALGPGWNEAPADTEHPMAYLPEIAGRATNGKAPAETHKAVWGLCAAVLGKRSNVQAFRRSLMSDYEILADVKITRMFASEKVRSGPNMDKPKVTAQGRQDGRDIYLEFVGDELTAEAERMRFRLPWTVTVRAAERTISSGVVQARFDVAEVSPPANDRYIKECLVGGLHVGGNGKATLTAWQKARDVFLETLAALRNLPPPPDSEPSDEPMAPDEYLGFAQAVEDGKAVSVRALTAARLFEQANHGVGRTSEKARLDVGNADRLSEELFAQSFALRWAFLRRAGERVLDNLGLWQTADEFTFSGDRGRLAEEIWNAFFLVVPVCSSTMASVARLFEGCSVGFLGDAIIDEAGQAPPHSAVGVLMRARRAVIIGDPRQIEPVVTIPDGVSALLAKHAGIPSDAFLIGSRVGTSVQTIADRASPIGATIGTDRIGCPLTVNRRNAEPMLSVSNLLAYGGMIVSGAPPMQHPEGIGGHACCWIDVDDDGSAVKNRVPAQERIVLDMVRQAVTDRSDIMDDGMPDWFVVSPFRSSAVGIRKIVMDHADLLIGVKREAVEVWTTDRVGTIHTVQGREAPCVLMVLGGTAANVRAVAWAGAKPNLVNVAASRAKRVAHFIGNRKLWTEHGGVFRELSEDRTLGMAFPSLPIPAGHTVDCSTTEWKAVEALPLLVPTAATALTPGARPPLRRGPPLPFGGFVRRSTAVVADRTGTHIRPPSVTVAAMVTGATAEIILEGRIK